MRPPEKRDEGGSERKTPQGEEGTGKEESGLRTYQEQRWRSENREVECPRSRWDHLRLIRSN